MLSELQQRLLNDFQRDFPLSATPYRDIAERLGVAEAEVLRGFQELSDQQMISRIGPVIAPNHIGSSALVAMAVPEDDLQRVAELVSSYREVNHNYQRDNRFNLWFVAMADDEAKLKMLVRDIETVAGYPAMLLPMLADYFIDLGFELDLHA